MTNINSNHRAFTQLKSIGVSLLLTTTLLGFVSTAYAAKKDLTQEITIKSKRQSADLKNKIASYLEDVSIRQGSIAITADIVQVFSKTNEKTGKKYDTYLAKGKPALFQQQLEDGSLISLQANEIKYQPEQNIITVSGNAQVRQAGSKVTGEIITYNTLNEKLEAESNSEDSVTTILQPAQIKAQQDKNNASKVDNKDSDNND
ncbi:MAG: lipopolysaccharide transport periplasmic protein LptA [Colwellia sp.]|nr:lipopolysaccharide transport periplasmic protein LptA [Colwellia sp.]MCW9081739.1 lipopolysaccharide transport periplasmic protein LptA [Colwellia sp.]